MCQGHFVPFVSLTLTASSINSDQERSGLPGFYNVSLLACHDSELRQTSTFSLMLFPKNTNASALLSVRVKTLSVWIALFEARYILTTHDGPYGLQDCLCTLSSQYRSSVTQLLNEINTQYRWMVSPFPTGTFTLQDTLSFAQRDNDSITRVCSGTRMCDKMEGTNIYTYGCRGKHRVH